MLVNVSNDRLDAVIKGYAERRARGIAQRSLTTMRAEILKQFEENDTRRGIPYLAVTENVSTDYLIRGSGKASYKGDEEPWVGKYDNLDFSFDDEEVEEEVYEAELVDDSDDVEEEIEGVSQGMQDLLKSLSSGGAQISTGGGMDRDAELAEETTTDDENISDYTESGVAAPEEDETEYPPHAVDANGFDVYSKEGEFVDAAEYYNEQAEDEEDGYEEFDFDEEDDEEDEDPPAPVSNSLPSLGGGGGLPSISEGRSQSLPSLGGSTEPTQQQGIAEKKVVRKVIKRVVKTKPKPIKEESFADLVERKRESVNTRPAKSKPQDRAAEEGIRTLRDLVKRHPNCDIKLAEQYFPRKEIEREVRMGRVFLKAEKLTI